MLIISLALIVSAIAEEVPYLDNEKKSVAIRETYTDIPEDAKDPYLNRQIDFKSLQQINKDIVGWIFIPDTPIDYPVVKNSYDDEYLSRDYVGAYNQLGSIFMRSSVNEDFSGKHTILYGHNLVDNQMFGWLSEYASNETKTNYPYVYIYLPNKVLRGNIYSAYVCADATDTYRTQFVTTADYKAWQEITALFGGVENYVFRTETILTLSTCTDRGDARFVVHSTLEKMKKEGQEKIPAKEK